MTSEAPYGSNVATLPDADTNNAKNLGGEKETTETMHLVAFDATEKRDAYHDPRMAVVVDARWYMGRSARSSVVYCSVWIRTRDGRHFAGHGSAGGWGYHKQSAAFDSAVRSAGIKLAAHVNGCGDGAIRHAMTAIAKAAGYGRCPQTII